MFTGIVQTQGIVRGLVRQSAGARLTVAAAGLDRPIAVGASVCVSGTCLTVTADEGERITFDVVPETLQRSTLGQLRPGDAVNLERSLRAGDRLDGHLVQGHIDGIGRLERIRDAAGEQLWTFTLPAELMPYMIPKGSVALDGISLTLAEVHDRAVSVALIPTTLVQTTLGSMRIGATVNVETDILARTLVTTLQRWRARGETVPEPVLNIDQLRSQGW